MTKELSAEEKRKIVTAIDGAARVGVACHKYGIDEPTYYAWKNNQQPSDEIDYWSLRSEHGFKTTRWSRACVFPNVYSDPDGSRKVRKPMFLKETIPRSIPFRALPETAQAVSTPMPSQSSSTKRST